MRYDIEDLQNHNGIVASNGINHEEAIKRLKPDSYRVWKARFRHERKVSLSKKRANKADS